MINRKMPKTDANSLIAYSKYLLGLKQSWKAVLSKFKYVSAFVCR